MNVDEYLHYRPDFPEYNVAQRAVIPFCDDDCNIVVSFGTAVGKTVIAECAFGYHLSNDGVVAYIAPYRSLCKEKFEKWQDDIYLNTNGVAIRTGEQRSRDTVLEKARLTVMTCESFDVRTRRNASWMKWLSSLQCVVFDEAHMIGDESRGAALESAMMRLTDFNKDCRLILLSATMDNARELAKWVKSLNGKPTKCCVSDWRPNEVTVVEVPVSGMPEMIDEAVKIAKENSGKTIIFVHSKRLGKDVLSRLRKVKVKSAFHNASVPKKTREKIERLFNSPTSGMDTLVSTSTLSAGVNIG